MTSPEILVTGAAGGMQGATGNHVTRMLLERGIGVRAFVRRDDERSDNLRALGAEIVQGDLRDLQSVRGAMKGIRRAYFTYPVQEGLLEATAIFASAGRAAQLEQVVNLSQHLSVMDDQLSPHQKHHALSEQILNWADIGTVHLDATVFFENLRAMARGSLARAGAILLPWGPDTTTLPMVSAEDVARVAVGLLQSHPLANATVLPLIGDVVTVRDIKEAFGEALGHAVPYHDITDAQWAEGAFSAGLNDVAVLHLSNLWRHFRTRNPELHTDYKIAADIERFGGQPPKSLRTFLAEQAHVFSVAAAAP
jgi:uncharacterized protein YbjT (DUF2867 family)